MTLKQLSLYFITVFGFFACSNQPGQRNKQLLQAAVQEVNTDSAFHLLSSVEINQLSEKDFAVYTVLRVKLKERMGQDISEDTLVFKAKDYLMQINDPYTDIALFMAANVHSYRGETTLAINNYLEVINKTENNLFIGYVNYNIARLHYSQGAYIQSLELLNKADRYYHATNAKYEDHMHSFELRALNYLYLNRLDSALNYFNKAEELALLHNDSKNLLRIIQNTSFALCEAKEYERAKEKCIKAISLVKKDDYETIGKLQIVQTYLHIHASQYDSAFICISKAYDLLKDAENDMVEIYRLFSSIEEERGNYKKALHYNQLHSSAKEVVSEKRINYQKANQDSNIQRIQQERDAYLKSERNSYIIGFLGMALLAALLVVAFYINKERLRERFKELKNQFSNFQQKVKSEKAKLERELEEIQEAREKERTLFLTEKRAREREQSEKEEIQRERAKEQELYLFEKEQIHLEWEKKLAKLKDQTLKEQAEFMKYQELTLRERYEYLNFRKEAIDSREDANQEKEAFRIFKKTAEKEKEELHNSIEASITEKEKLEAEINISKKLCNEERKRLIDLINDISELWKIIDAHPVNYKEVRRQMKQINSRLFFDNIFPVLDYAYNGLLVKMRDEYTKLTETEYRLLVLACAGFGSKEIYIVMELTTCHSADSHKSKLRRKLNLVSRSSFEDFFINKYGISEP